MCTILHCKIKECGMRWQTHDEKHCELLQSCMLEKKVIVSRQDLNLGLLIARQMLLTTEPVEPWHWS